MRRSCGLTLGLSGGWKRAKHAGRRPVDGWVSGVAHSRRQAEFVEFAAEVAQYEDSIEARLERTNYGGRIKLVPGRHCTNVGVDQQPGFVALLAVGSVFGLL